jgi:hypothetical protein
MPDTSSPARWQPDMVVPEPIPMVCHSVWDKGVKNLRFTITASLLAGLLFATPGVAEIGQRGAPALAEIGRVKSNVGIAAVDRSGRRLAVAPGVELEPGDVLVTGPGGRIGVTFIDDTRMAVGPNSRVVLTSFQYDRVRQTGSFVTSVDRGTLGVVSGRIAKSGRDAMRVRTPTSMLGVRGTRFVVDVP